jgi:hypothetical protein
LLCHTYLFSRLLVIVLQVPKPDVLVVILILKRVIRLAETVPIKDAVGLGVVNSKIWVEWSMRGYLVVLDHLGLDVVQLLNLIINNRPQFLNEFWLASA